MNSTHAMVLIRIGGVACLGWLVFHLFFWRLFDWKSQLGRLSAANRGVMQVLNLCLSFVFLLCGVMSLTYPNELLAPGLGRGLLWGMAVFWLLRLIEQPVFFGVSRISNLFSLLFLLTSLFYLLPVLLTRAG
jgi:hypothetical protein